ncbi:4-diphosphocytidyl-2c-methyl-D-erythritol kinase [Theileria orientalis strain Shintoku]|uniref:4-diphosphocytidyl-2c-methyl-D-erythritol kinase n=1 Tax=Theileria orientalis strain Shintoku TaxID=869250 RepID=J4CD34_THEOR|nr:4-diphosphocytidyl-2c-methyl-D-erythritol kinase [Theileria orientalis strain Shintoku]PVC52132.1 4-diphosphocytidyl-2c-methyl-D-erythritol kinase [Theileria orientalis]BAM40447.1 4-diphosphocytidyl-2c-methyl-D-erythritol kinase [Theileria orientalis strain Shintoku]|eukprot:XP_009690748.1 4-diphosphocytidyl-2c-methyl-D-erythritol kinase [Theileria orientalis strain Shintoku]
MKLAKCVAFLNVLNLVTGDKNKNIIKDEKEVFKKINSKLTANRAENYDKFWDSVNNSFAKINLTLNIDTGSNVLDKYLNLCSLMQKLTWGNKLFIKAINKEESHIISDCYNKTDEGDYLLLIDDTPRVPDVSTDSLSNFPFDNRNIIARVLNKLRSSDRNYIVLTKKSIPLGSGLGGGSSDAATVINQLFKGRLYDLATIGSDVPFLASKCKSTAFMSHSGDTACVFGIGDKMYEFYNKIYSDWVYLVIPQENVSTELVYRKARDLLKGGKIRKRDIHRVIMETVRKVEGLADIKALVPDNDLERCVENAKVTRLSKILKKAFRSFGMTGSGCSFFVFADDDSEVTSIRDKYKKPLMIVKTKFKYDTEEHEYEYL